MFIDTITQIYTFKTKYGKPIVVNEAPLDQSPQTILSIIKDFERNPDISNDRLTGVFYINVQSKLVASLSTSPCSHDELIDGSPELVQEIGSIEMMWREGESGPYLQAVVVEEISCNQSLEPVKEMLREHATLYVYSRDSYDQLALTESPEI